MWTTAFTRQYDLDLPFASAGMGFYALPQLTAAISNASGLGVLGASPAPAAAMAEMVRAVKQLTSRPFGVDLIVSQSCRAHSIVIAGIHAAHTCIGVTRGGQIDRGVSDEWR